jgi:hypothetical protein
MEVQVLEGIFVKIEQNLDKLDSWEFRGRR